MRTCPCSELHVRRHVVLTGGPGAGKTAVLELIRRSFCEHVKILPEAAGILFGGGFPRGPAPELLRPVQRAIFYVQRELEAVADAGPAVVLCDRGTVDGVAYWPGPGDFWAPAAAAHPMRGARQRRGRGAAHPGGRAAPSELRVEGPAAPALSLLLTGGRGQERRLRWRYSPWQKGPPQKDSRYSHSPPTHW